MSISKTISSHSSAWSADFPESTPDSSQLPKAWVDALNAAVTAGKIPNLPSSTSSHGSEPKYSDLDPNGAEVCSSTYKCMQNSPNIWNAPDGYFASSFDDGPQPVSVRQIERGPYLISFVVYGCTCRVFGEK
jgi:hypothetical protein